MHYVANASGDYAGAASVGFNLVDVGSVSALRQLPPGTQAVFWLGNGYNSVCSWRLDDQQVTNTVKLIKDHPKFSGIYFISDEPHPDRCLDAPRRVAERTALIHSLDPQGKTFIVVLNGSAHPTEFAKMKDSADYIGVDPYPCNVRNEQQGCNLPALRQRIDQAIAAGIETRRIVPVFQTFGQTCPENRGQGYYRLPNVSETKSMLQIWDEKVPPKVRPFDMAYSWNQQRATACPTLQTADGKTNPDLRSVYKDYFERLLKESQK